MRRSLAIMSVVLAGVLGGSAQEPAKSELAIKSGQKIAFLGDSITAQGAGPAGYVTLTIAGLKANGIDASAIGAGVSGHKSNDMLARLGRDVLDKKPDWMTLSCGVNDVWHGARGVPLEQYKSNITAIIERAQATNIHVMVLTATVITEDLAAENNQKLAAYNDFLRELAKEKKCLLADLNADFQEALKTKKMPGNMLTGDGVHMNWRGNQVMAKGILRAFGLNEAQMQKAQEAWLDIPDTCKLGALPQAELKFSERQYRSLVSFAAKHDISAEQLACMLYAAPAFGLTPGATTAEIEAFLTKHAKAVPAAAMQECLTNSIRALSVP